MIRARLRRYTFARIRAHVTRQYRDFREALLVTPHVDAQGAPEAVFADITVVPPKHPYYHGAPGAQGRLCAGPVYPADHGGYGNWVRHRAHRSVVDHLPESPTGEVTRLDGPAVWLGYLHTQFGHLVAESATRMLWSRSHRPNDTYLFAMAPGATPVNAGLHVRDVMAWFGLPKAQLRQVTGPLLVEELRVFPQAELLGGAGPCEDYLALLARNAAAAGIAPIKSEVLFVTRAGMLALQTGSHAGEGYLRDVLAGMGVVILDPARKSVRSQIAHYLGAKRIIFSEGSALHGRQLLGRLPQDVVVLNRRPQNRTAEGALRPRVRELTYAECAGAIASPVRNGKPVHNHGLSFYDTDVLLDSLQSVCPPLRKAWRPAAYAQAVERDIALWAHHLSRSVHGYDKATLIRLARETSGFKQEAAA